MYKNPKTRMEKTEGFLESVDLLKVEVYSLQTFIHQKEEEVFFAAILHSQECH